MAFWIMSGHSHYATIRRQKEARDAAKGRLFSKLARMISIAVRTGGSADPEANYKLRMAIETARSFNMPKENIERAISASKLKQENIFEVVYEGFAPGGVAVMVEAATDNRNRTSQEIKNIFERGGGSLAGPGSVAFNFEPKGMLLVKKSDNPEDQMLKLIELGVDDLVETEDGIEVYVAPDEVGNVRSKIKDLGFEVLSFELIQKPKNKILIQDLALAEKVLRLLDNLEEHEDVQKVYANLDIPTEILNKINV